jgi:hypothetical protein
MPFELELSYRNRSAGWIPFRPGGTAMSMLYTADPLSETLN